MDHPVRVSRRDFVRVTACAGLLTALGLTGCARSMSVPGPGGAGPGGLSMALSWVPDVSNAGLWIALEKGYLQDAGVELTYQPGGPNTPAAVESVSSGQTDVGEQSNMAAFIDAVGKGNDLVLYGTRYQRNPAGLLSLARNPVLKPADLVGKRILGPAAVDAESVRAVLRVNGLPEEFEFIPSGASPEPLLRGQGDAQVIATTNQPITLEQQEGMTADRDFFARSYDHYGLPRYSSMMFAPREYVKENRNKIVAMLRALRQGWTDNEKDPELAAQLAVDKFGSDLGLQLDQQRRQNQVQIPYLRSADTDVHGLFWIDRDRLGGPMYNGLRASGRSDLPDVDSVLDMSLLSDAR